MGYALPRTLVYQHFSKVRAKNKYELLLRLHSNFPVCCSACRRNASPGRARIIGWASLTRRHSRSPTTANGVRRIVLLLEDPHLGLTLSRPQVRALKRPVQ
jgi:hypothetical protein